MDDKSLVCVPAAGADNSDGKRKRVPSRKYEQFVMDNKQEEEDGHCPGCKLFVKKSDKGVVCFSCVAYWHYGCAGVTEEEVANLGEDEFYCREHAADKAVATKVISIDGAFG